MRRVFSENPIPVKKQQTPPESCSSYKWEKEIKKGLISYRKLLNIHSIHCSRRERNQQVK